VVGPAPSLVGALRADGGVPAGRYHEGVRRYFSARCIALHVTLLVVLPAFALLTRWQLDRALGGNTLSWAYTFEWPLFAGYAVYVWWQLVRDNARPGARTRSDTSEVSDVSDDGRASITSGPTGGVGGSDTVGATSGVGGRSRAPHLEPGWALTGGRERNVAIAAASAIDLDRDGRRERFAEQTPEEAEQLAAYNRYLAELAAADETATRQS
jgi:hypothetical protein